MANKQLGKIMDFVSALPAEALIKLLAPIGLTILAVLFWWRAGSTHSIMERLWNITAGNTTVKDPDLAELIEQTREVEKFRFIFRINIDRTEDLRRFLAWRKLNRVSIRTIQSLRRWFNVTEKGFITRPSYSTFAFLIFILAGLYLFLAASIFLSASHNAILTMKDSNTQFKTDGVIIQSLFGKWQVDTANCDKLNPIIANNFGFTNSEATLVCDSARNGSLKIFAAKALKEQVKIGITLEIICAALLLAVMREFLTAINARRFPETLKVPNRYHDPI